MSDVNETLEEAKKVLAEVMAEEEQEAAQEAPVEGEKEQEAAQGEQEFYADKAAAQFDVTRTARKEALKKTEEILESSAPDKDEVLKCMRGLYMVTFMQDALITSLMADFVRSIRSMAKVEVDIVNGTAKLFTVTQALYKKGLVTQEEMEKIHQEITVPQLMANLKGEAGGSGGEKKD